MKRMEGQKTVIILIVEITQRLEIQDNQQSHWFLEKVWEILESQQMFQQIINRKGCCRGNLGTALLLQWTFK